MARRSSNDLLNGFIKALVATPGGVSIRYYAHKQGISYYRLYRLARRLATQGYLTLTKVDGLLWAKPTSKTLELIVKNEEDKGPRRNYHWTKWQARAYLKRIQVIEDWTQLKQLFALYIEDTEKRRIVLYNENTGEFLVKDYEHRFTPKRLAQAMRKFEEAWAYLARGATSGVFLTITMDPKQHKNLYLTNKLGRQQWDRVRRWIAKRLAKQGIKLKYMAIPEFTQRGVIHLHVVIFGPRRIGDKFTEITPELQRVGYGKVNYVSQIRLAHDNVFVWAQKPPEDTKENKVKDYLKKYLKKAFNSPLTQGAPDLAQKPEDLKIALYWALDLRFFTHSRIENPTPRLKPLPSPWRFVGSYYIWAEILWVLEDYPSLGPPPLAIAKKALWQ